MKEDLKIGDTVEVLPVEEARTREDGDDYSSAFWQECGGKEMVIESRDHGCCIAHLSDGDQKRYVLYESDINQTRPRH